MGLGNAFVAVADDASAAYWNPAGLALLQRPSVSSMYSQMSLNRQFNTFSLALPLSVSSPAEAFNPLQTSCFPPQPVLGGWGSWALSWVGFSLGQDFEGRSSDTSSFTTFGDQQDAYILSHGRALASWLALGASAKFLRRSLAASSAQGAGFDLGLLALLHEHLRLGVQAGDIASRQAWDTGYVENFPTCTRIGLASPWLKGALLLTGQVQGVQGQQPRYQAGAEAWVYGILGARAGYDDGSFTAGGSLDLKLFYRQLRFDYGFAADSLGLGDTQRFSLLFWF
jgi:hypothetical protein